LEKCDFRRLDLSSKRICVTGGGGFLGSFVVEALRARGCRDVFVPRQRDYDLTTTTGIERMFTDARPQVLFHLAAVVGGIGANANNPGSFFYKNAIMGIQLLEHARLSAVEKTVVAGTICAYPKFASIPFREDALWDGYPEETNAPYGIAKKALLVQCQAYRQQYGMSAVYLLPVNLYGPRDNFDLESSHVIPAIIRKAVTARDARRPSFTCWGDGSPTREFIYVADAAEALILAAERYDGAEPVNVGSSREISIRELAQTISRIAGFTGEIRWDTSRPNGQPRRKLDVTKAAELFGFHAQTSFEDGLRETLAWYEEQYARPSVPA
jgi:GDP-L-fucose synthase